MNYILHEPYVQRPKYDQNSAKSGIYFINSGTAFHRFNTGSVLGSILLNRGRVVSEIYPCFCTSCFDHILVVKRKATLVYLLQMCCSLSYFVINFNIRVLTVFDTVVSHDCFFNMK